MTAVQSRLTIASVVATMLAALTLAPLLLGLGWFVAVFVLVGVTAGSGAIARQLVRWWPAVVAVQVVALALTLTGLFARDAALWGVLPGPDVIGVLRELIDAGLGVTRQQAPPVQSTRGVILLVAGGLALVGLLVDVIAVTLRKPAVAGLPLLAIYCVPAAVLPGGLSWPYFAFGAVGYLVLVGADSGDRVRSWGRVLTASGADDSERALGGPLAGARRLAVGCVLAAAVLPAAVPGLGSQLIGSNGAGKGTGKGGNITVVNPILKLRENLTARDNVVVIRYRTSAQTPEPLRIVSDDVFDGNTWSPSIGAIPRDNRVTDGLPPAPGLSPLVQTTALTTRINILNLEQTYLPLPYPATKVSDIRGNWLYESRSLNVVGDHVNTRNLSYTVQHQGVNPTAAQLKATAPPPIQIATSYGQVPETLPAQIGDIAHKVTQDAGTAYERALLLQQYFRSTGGFTYSEQVVPSSGKGDGSQDAVLSFLKTKKGYCVQFASAMAVMSRAMGIPARVAVGFLPGTRQSDGSFAISIRDAHAWPELYFQSLGWVRFEPTPGTRSGAPPAWAVPAVPAAPAATETASASAVPQQSQSARRNPGQEDRSTSSVEAPLWQRVLGAIPWRVLAVLLVMMLIAAIPLISTLIVRRARWRRAGSPTSRVEIAWEELRERLEDLGVRWASSWTPRALQLRLVSDHSLGDPQQAALGRLVHDLELVRYAPPGAVLRPADELRADLALVVSGVVGSAAIQPWARRRARWAPASGARTISRLFRRVDIAADQAGRRVGELGSEVRKAVHRH